MGKFILSFATGQILGKAFAFGGIVLIFNLLPFMISWLPGVSISAGEWSFDFFNPLQNALQLAPQGFRWFIKYFYIDFAITIAVTASVWGLAKDIVLGGK